MLRFVQVADRVPSTPAECPPRRVPDRRTEAPGELADAAWYSPDGKPVDWQKTFHSLTCVLGTSGVDDPAARAMLIMLHAGGRPQKFVIPPAAQSIRGGSSSIRPPPRRATSTQTPTARRRHSASPCCSTTTRCAATWRRNRRMRRGPGHWLQSQCGSRVTLTH